MKTTKNNRQGKDNKFFIVLYPDSTTYDIEVVFNNIRFISTKYAYILHDNDCDENGEIKKSHYHVYFKLENQASIETVAKSLEVENNCIQFAVNERGCCRYLIHLDNPEKHQYSQDSIITDFDIYKYLVDKDLENMSAIAELYTYISVNRCKTFNELVNYCLTSNRADLVKCVTNKAYFFRQLLNENKER